mmetsp:Transcript_17816/g.37023  ORF Transcript_17816/g.37023 Transcript_17816/m.37023 type:complete len:114 (-) Transcript_17816:575-916(-)
MGDPQWNEIDPNIGSKCGKSVTKVEIEGRRVSEINKGRTAGGFRGCGITRILVLTLCLAAIMASAQAVLGWERGEIGEGGGINESPLGVKATPFSAKISSTVKDCSFPASFKA